ncbi:MAG TPA: peptidyl-tRNA hydrolase Pth2 [Candidatus Thermoplasmatota archaeon]
MGSMKVVVVVRLDLDLSRGKTAVQVAHASVMCAMESRARARPWFDRWLEEGQRKVVLKAPDLKALGQLKEKAAREGLVAVLVQDAGLTEVEPGTVTVLGIGPAPDEAVDTVTGHLPLY